MHDSVAGGAVNRELVDGEVAFRSFGNVDPGDGREGRRGELSA